jgi:hypothetical protein
LSRAERFQASPQPPRPAARRQWPRSTSHWACCHRSGALHVQRNRGGVELKPAGTPEGSIQVLCNQIVVNPDESRGDGSNRGAVGWAARIAPQPAMDSTGTQKTNPKKRLLHFRIQVYTNFGKHRYTDECQRCDVVFCRFVRYRLLAWPTQPGRPRLEALIPTTASPKQHTRTLSFWRRRST